MELFYISPSVFPSRSANSVHVAHQCQGFSRLGVNVTLFAKRSVRDTTALLVEMRRAYGVELTGVRVNSYYSRGSRGDNLRIAALALRRLARERRTGAVILSRNLYASYVAAVLWQRRLVFETHQLETGFRKRLQRAVMIQPHVTTVVISEKLRELLIGHHGVAPARALVLRDAAPEGIEPLPAGAKRRALAEIAPGLGLEGRALTCGYFGHLYPGRGIEVIEHMARARPDAVFLIFGGHERDIEKRRAANALPNLRYLGFMPHSAAQRAMAAVDVLLMPYQDSVSIGVKDHDTARWMSPMKMFEYLASGTPIISSDLPALREVLRDGDNALLVPPDDIAAWTCALDRLRGDPALAMRLGERAHACYAAEHTWTMRARRILDAAR